MVEQTNSVYYDNFVPKVAKGRNKTAEEVNTIGQGRVWTGTQAKATGLSTISAGSKKRSRSPKNSPIFRPTRTSSASSSRPQTILRNILRQRR